MATHMDLDNNPRKRFRSDDDDYSTEDCISKKARLALFDASPRDFARSPPLPPPPQTDDSSAASTPASLDIEMDTNPFSARVLSAQQPPSTAAVPAAARPGQERGQGQGCTIIAGWNQARRMELCLQGYPPALRLQLSSWLQAQA